MEDLFNFNIDPYVFTDAVREFWNTREKQAQLQKIRGTKDQGSRSAVTGGKQMDGFARKIAELLTRVGIDRDCIHFGKSPTTLPGYYRPTKDWDIVVVVNNQLVAAIELKSQVGPSFGNNFNNRTEEALGTAEDIWTAYREGKFQMNPTPWLGYLFLLEDCEESRKPVAVREPYFEVFPDFRDASYAKRYELFCKRLVLERKYSAACFLMANRSKADETPNYWEPNPDLSASVFLEQLLRHAYLVSKGLVPLKNKL